MANLLSSVLTIQPPYHQECMLLSHIFSYSYLTSWFNSKYGNLKIFMMLTYSFFLGNTIIHKLTTKFKNSLYIKMKKLSEHSLRFALYSSFSISNQTTDFRLSLGKYSGNKGRNIKTWILKHFDTNLRQYVSIKFICFFFIFSLLFVWNFTTCLILQYSWLN